MSVAEDSDTSQSREPNISNVDLNSWPGLFIAASFVSRVEHVAPSRLEAWSEVSGGRLWGVGHCGEFTWSSIFSQSAHKTWSALPSQFYRHIDVLIMHAATFIPTTLLAWRNSMASICMTLLCCLQGYKFAQQEAKITLVRLYQHFTFRLASGMPRKPKLKTGITTGPADGVPVVVHSRGVWTNASHLGDFALLDVALFSVQCFML